MVCRESENTTPVLSIRLNEAVKYPTLNPSKSPKPQNIPCLSKETRARRQRRGEMHRDDQYRDVIGSAGSFYSLPVRAPEGVTRENKGHSFCHPMSYAQLLTRVPTSLIVIGNHSGRMWTQISLVKPLILLSILFPLPLGDIVNDICVM